MRRWMRKSGTSFRNSQAAVDLGRWSWFVVLLANLGFPLRAAAADAPRPVIPILRPTRIEPVDFYREIVPLLQANCLPCHNQTTTKADLRLETPDDMLKGGESGPALVPGKADESLLLRLSTHAEKPRMPPKDNKVNAVDLTPEQLGLLALWIDQGAKASEKHAEVIAWKPMAADFQTIFAVALSTDGQFAACGRANRLFIYHVPSRSLLQELTDPAVAATNHGRASAHLDVINALAFNPVDHTLASGGFREVKLWRPTRTAASPISPPSPWPPASLRSEDGTSSVVLTTNGGARFLDKDGKPLAEVRPDAPGAAQALARADSQLAIARQRAEAAKTAVEAAVKESNAQQERLKKAREAEPAAAKAAAEKRVPFEKARREVALLEGRLAQVERVQFPSTNTAALKKQVEEKLAAARKALEGPEAEFAKAERGRSNAENETALARIGVQNATSARLLAEARLRQAELDLRAAEQRLAQRRGETNSAAFTATAIDPTGRLAATAQPAGLLQLWDASSGQELASTTTGLTNVTQFHWNALDELIAGNATAAAAWKFLPEWRLAERLGTGAGDSPIADRVNALTFSPDGTRLASGSGEPTRGSEIRIWDSRTAAQVYAVTNLHSDAVLSLAFSPDGHFLASGGADRFARAIETGTGRPVRALEGHTGHVLSVAWKADGEVLASGGADNVVKLWNWAKGERLKNVEGFGKEITGLQFLGSGEQWAGASGAGKIRLLNLKGEESASLPAGSLFTQSLAASEDGLAIAAGGDDGILRVWSVKERKIIAEFPAPPAK